MISCKTFIIHLAQIKNIDRKDLYPATVDPVFQLNEDRFNRSWIKQLMKKRSRVFSDPGLVSHQPESALLSSMILIGNGGYRYVKPAVYFIWALRETRPAQIAIDIPKNNNPTFIFPLFLSLMPDIIVSRWLPSAIIAIGASMIFEADIKGFLTSNICTAGLTGNNIWYFQPSVTDIL